MICKNEHKYFYNCQSFLCIHWSVEIVVRAALQEDGAGLDLPDLVWSGPGSILTQPLEDRDTVEVWTFQ